MSIEARISSTTTCDSETDAYETSSEGRIRLSQAGGSKKDDISANDTTRMGPRQMEAENPASKESKSTDAQKAACPSSILPKSESMPALRSASSKEEEEEEETNDEENVTVDSESSLARQRKLNMIVARMEPFLSSESTLSVAAFTDASKTDLTDENYEAKKLDSKTTLPVLQDEETDLSSYPKEVTFREVLDDRGFTKNKSLQSIVRVTEGRWESQTEDDLIDIAENPQASIKSFYLPPNPQEREGPLISSRKQSRATNDLETLLRIDDELGPLQHKLNEITGKFRALNLTAPSLLGQRLYSNRGTLSSNASGYYLHRAETFGRDTSVSDLLCAPGKQVPAFVERSSWEDRSTDCLGPLSHRPLVNEAICLGRSSFPMKETLSKATNVGNEWSTKYIHRNLSNVESNWLLGQNDSCLTLKNSFVHFDRDPSGSLIPATSSSCYRRFRNRPIDSQIPNTSLHFEQFEARGPSNSFSKQSTTVPAMDQPGPSRCIESLSKLSDHGRLVSIRYENKNESMKPEQKRQENRTDGYTAASRFSDKKIREKMPIHLPEALIVPATNKTSDIGVISVNTQVCSTLEKQYVGRIVVKENSRFEDAVRENQGSIEGAKTFEKDTDSSSCPRDQSASTSFTMIGTDGSNETRYVKYTRVDSQTSLIISKKGRSVGTSSLEQTKNATARASTQLIAKDKDSASETKVKNRDFEVQCSRYGMNFQRNETILRRSAESLLKHSESEESNAPKPNSDKTRVMQVPKAEEKVIIVPILFTDGIPEPSNVPLFNFAKSKLCLPRASHHTMKLKKGASCLTQSSVLSRTSTESYAMESYLSQRLTNRDHWPSRMSVSCVSHGKTPSQLSNAVKTLSERCQRTGKARRPGSMISGSTNKAHSEPTKRATRNFVRGMRSTPEDFLCDT